MRIFASFPEAQNEIRRDLNELGMSVHPETMQDIEVKDKPEYETKELGNYLYMVTDPDFVQIEDIHKEWVEAEWMDRLTGDLNPGQAWKKRPEIWTPFMHKDHTTGKKGRFAYTYSERVGGNHITKLIDELKKHPNSRQLWLNMWRVSDEDKRGKKRVPCTLGYWFNYRGEKLHMTYMMRSCDFITHYPNDVCLASMLLHHVADQAKMEVGFFTHFIGSLHVYAKDVKDSF